MAGFKALDAAEPLDYDFNPYLDIAGTIVEPTSDQIDVFRQSMTNAYTELDIDPEMLKAAVSGDIGDHAESVLAHFGEIMASTSELETKTAQIVAVLCAGSPSEENIMALPYRVRQAFLGWVTGTFFSPEA